MTLSRNMRVLFLALKLPNRNTVIIAVHDTKVCVAFSLPVIRLVVLINNFYTRASLVTGDRQGRKKFRRAKRAEERETEEFGGACSQATQPKSVIKITQQQTHG